MRAWVGAVEPYLDHLVAVAVPVGDHAQGAVGGLLAHPGHEALARACDLVEEGEAEKAEVEHQQPIGGQALRHRAVEAFVVGRRIGVIKRADGPRGEGFHDDHHLAAQALGDRFGCGLVGARGLGSDAPAQRLERRAVGDPDGGKAFAQPALPLRQDSRGGSVFGGCALGLLPLHHGGEKVCEERGRDRAKPLREGLARYRGGFEPESALESENASELAQRGDLPVDEAHHEGGHGREREYAVAQRGFGQGEARRGEGGG